MDLLKKQCRAVREITDFVPRAALTLGSGLGELEKDLEIECAIDYQDIPGFPVSTAPGHKGRLVFAKISGVNTVIMQGRVHLYEGYSPSEVVNYVRLVKLLGAKELILTNAAGGINENFKPGDFMIITDHISSFVPSPLIGRNCDELGKRFPDMTSAYSPLLCDALEESAKKAGAGIHRGVYIQLPGPQFETPAEIRMCRTLGADAVGMSTVCEAIAAAHCSLPVCALSCITNYAAGITGKPLTSGEVNETAGAVSAQFNSIIKDVIKKTCNYD